MIMWSPSNPQSIASGFVDSNLESPKSTTGYIFKMAGAMVIAKSKKQPVTAVHGGGRCGGGRYGGSRCGGPMGNMYGPQFVVWVIYIIYTPLNLYALGPVIYGQGVYFTCKLCKGMGGG